MNCEYVRNFYKVPACIGRKINYKGRDGIISEDRGNYIGVTFDDEKPGTISNLHPLTDGLEYLGIGKVRKMTKSQQRYKRYLEFGDCFDSFRDFLSWDLNPEREWNKA